MAQINLIIGYDCETGKCLDDCIFGKQFDWKGPALSSKFYGTVGVMTEAMATRGALPGMLAMCPTIIPIEGAWLFRHIVEKIVKLDSDAVVTVFLDAKTYKSVMDYSGIGNVWVVSRGGMKEDGNKFKYRGWSPLEDTVDELDNDVTVVEYARDAKVNFSEDELDDEISWMELEMNDVTDAEIPEKFKRELDRLSETICRVWELFEKYDKDMVKYLGNTESDLSVCDMGIDGEDNPLDGMPGSFGEQLHGPEGEALERPASLRIVTVLANTVNQLSEFGMKNRALIVEAKRQTEEVARKVAELDKAMCDTLKNVESTMGSQGSYVDECLSGIRNQLTLVITKERNKAVLQVACAAISAVCCAVCVIVNLL